MSIYLGSGLEFVIGLVITFKSPRGYVISPNWMNFGPQTANTNLYITRDRGHTQNFLFEGVSLMTS